MHLYLTLTTCIMYLTITTCTTYLSCPLVPDPPITILQMSALFNFQSLLTVLLLCICTCAYIRSFWPSILDRCVTPHT